MKYSLCALPLMLMLVTGTAAAVDPIEGQFSVTGTVPSESFTILDPGGWMSLPQELPYTPVGEKFGTFNQQLMLRSTVGAIKAYLVEPAEVRKGDEVVPMNVVINNRGIVDTPREIARADQAGPGILVNFSTYPTDNTQKPSPGDYSGTLSLMFETSPPL
ncbi:MAG: CS1 type fimbrial major subunit [Pseudomonas sp.]|uniref:CS1 type fimbrial major subunit n=1 Tax=Pseudomonas sp. TaxID=306 RepID=UPI003D1053AE